MRDYVLCGILTVCFTACFCFWCFKEREQIISSNINHLSARLNPMAKTYPDKWDYAEAGHE